LLAQKFFIYQVYTRSTQPKGWIGFLEGANQWFKGGKRFVGSGVECAGDNSFSERGMVSECTKEREIGIELFMFTWKDRATSEKKFGT
jgi:hypothetical protein